MKRDIRKIDLKNRFKYRFIKIDLKKLKAVISISKNQQFRPEFQPKVKKTQNCYVIYVL